MGFPGSWAGKESTCHAGDPSSISRSEISPREELGCPLQDSWVSLVDQSTICLQWGGPGLNPCVVKIPWRQPTPVFLPGEAPRTEEPGRLQTMVSQRVRHDQVVKHSLVYYTLHIYDCWSLWINFFIIIKYFLIFVMHLVWKSILAY